MMEAISVPHFGGGRPLLISVENPLMSVKPGKKKAYTALLQRRTFLCRKKWGPQRKDLGGRYGFSGFYRVFVSTTGLESFLLGQKSSPKDFLSVVVVYAFFFSVSRERGNRTLVIVL